MNRRSFLRSVIVTLGAALAAPKDALIRLTESPPLWLPDTGIFRSEIAHEIIKPGRTFYVGAGGNDSGQGLSWEDRLSTLQAAEDRVGPGDTVFVGPGAEGHLWEIEKSGEDPIVLW